MSAWALLPDAACHNVPVMPEELMVDVIIPHYRGEDILLRCLRALRQSMDAGDAPCEVHIVDNAAEDGSTEKLAEIVIFEAPPDRSPPEEIEDRHPLDLAPLGLAKGDRLTVTLQAVDHRGPERQGESTETDPLVFQVTDERGILAAMAEADRESVDRLKTMIQRQIEVGESR